MNSIGGPDLLIWLVLAFGGAMFVGNLLALVRPPGKQEPRKDPNSLRPKHGAGLSKSGTKPPAPALAKAPRGRTITMMGVGGIASLWAIATLLSR